MLASVGCPFGRRGSDPRQVQSCRPTGAFACLDPPDTVTNRWIRAEWLRAGASLTEIRRLPSRGCLPGLIRQLWEAPVFSERTSVGLDVHARSVVAAAIDGDTGELVQSRLTPSFDQIRSWL